MAKRRKKTPTAEQVLESKPKRKEPKLSRTAAWLVLWLIAVCLLAQLVIAVIVYPSLPDTIPAGWIGSSMPHNPVPKAVVFLVFPGAQLILLVIASLCRKDKDDKRVMELGSAVGIVVLAMVFTALQASAFHIPR